MAPDDFSDEEIYYECKSHSELENLLSPFAYSEITDFPFPENNPKSVSGMHFKGHFSKDCNWYWTYNKNIIQVSPVNQSLLQDKAVSGVQPIMESKPFYFPANYFITCSTEIQMDSNTTMLLLGMECRSTGVIALFCPKKGQPVRCISCPRPVSSLAVLSSSKDPQWEKFEFESEALLVSEGMVAVGLTGGDILLVDLALDHYYSYEEKQIRSNWFTNSVSKPPFRMHFVEHHEMYVALRRSELTHEELLITLLLNRSVEDDDENFSFCTASGIVRETFPKSSVEVTALHYVRESGILVVGYSFGCFQVWDIPTLCLLYGSVCYNRVSSVFGFSFCEPADDPKNACYLWVMYGKNSLEFGRAYVELYSLEFDSKTVQESHNVYKDLKRTCFHLRFDLQDFYMPDDEETLLVRPIKIWECTVDEDPLTLFAWESSRPSLYYVGIFDINQWYSGHMSEDFRYVPASGLCPWWVAIPCDIISSEGEQEDFGIVDLQIVPSHMYRYSNPYLQLEIYDYPASVSFKMATLGFTGYGCFKFCGVQEKLFKKLHMEHVELMKSPSEIKKQFLTYGIRTVIPHTYGSEFSSYVADRFYLFSTLVDHRKTYIIVDCANSWLDGSYASRGCTIDIILYWLATIVASLRLQASEHWDIINHCYYEMLPAETIHFVHYSAFLWESMKNLFVYLTRPNDVYSRRPSFIEDVHYGLNKFASMGDGMRIMLNAKVLPAPYDVDIMEVVRKHHMTRRKTITENLEKCRILPSQMKKIKPMMIDYILEGIDEKELREEWDVLSGELQYPPKHAGSIMYMLLWASNKPKPIYQLIAYFILDLHYVVGINEVGINCPEVVQLNEKDLEEVYHLWLLDQGNCEDAVFTYMCQWGLQCGPWAAAHIIVTAAGKEQLVLEKLSNDCGETLAPLLLSLLVENPQLWSVFCTSDVFKKLTSSAEFLELFFNVCEENNLLKYFIEVPLEFSPPNVKNSLIQYLEKKNSYKTYETLLLVYMKSQDKENIEKTLNILRSFDGRLTDEQRRRLISLHKKAKESLEEKPKIFLQFLESHKVTSSKADLHVAATTVTISSRKETAPVSLTHERFLLSKVPPQLERLYSKEQRRAVSPLRKWVPMLNSCLTETPRVSKEANKDFSRRLTITMMDTNLRAIEESLTEDNNNSTSFQEQELGTDLTAVKHPMDLSILLKTPKIDVSKMRKPSASLPGTPVQQCLKTQGRKVRKSCSVLPNSLYYPSESHKVRFKDDRLSLSDVSRFFAQDDDDDNARKSVSFSQEMTSPIETARTSKRVSEKPSATKRSRKSKTSLSVSHSEENVVAVEEEVAGSSTPVTRRMSKMKQLSLDPEVRSVSDSKSTNLTGAKNASRSPAKSVPSAQESEDKVQDIEISSIEVPLDSVQQNKETKTPGLSENTAKDSQQTGSHLPKSKSKSPSPRKTQEVLSAQGEENAEKATIVPTSEETEKTVAPSETPAILVGPEIRVVESELNVEEKMDISDVIVEESELFEDTRMSEEAEKVQEKTSTEQLYKRSGRSRSTPKMLETPKKLRKTTKSKSLSPKEKSKKQPVVPLAPIASTSKNKAESEAIVTEKKSPSRSPGSPKKGKGKSPLPPSDADKEETPAAGKRRLRSQSKSPKKVQEEIRESVSGATDEKADKTAPKKTVETQSTSVEMEIAENVEQRTVKSKNRSPPSVKTPEFTASRKDSNEAFGETTSVERKNKRATPSRSKSKSPKTPIRDIKLELSSSSEEDSPSVAAATKRRRMLSRSRSVPVMDNLDETRRSNVSPDITARRETEKSTSRSVRSRSTPKVISSQRRSKKIKVESLSPTSKESKELICEKLEKAETRSRKSSSPSSAETSSLRRSSRRKVDRELALYQPDLSTISEHTEVDLTSTASVSRSLKAIMEESEELEEKESTFFEKSSVEQKVTTTVRRARTRSGSADRTLTQESEEMNLAQTSSAPVTRSTRRRGKHLSDSDAESVASSLAPSVSPGLSRNSSAESFDFGEVTAGPSKPVRKIKPRARTRSGRSETNVEESQSEEPEISPIKFPETSSPRRSTRKKRERKVFDYEMQLSVLSEQEEAAKLPEKKRTKKMAPVALPEEDESILNSTFETSTTGSIKTRKTRSRKASGASRSDAESTSSRRSESPQRRSRRTRKAV